MDNVGGVFVVLASGCTVALIIGVLEFLWNVRKVAVDERVSYSIYMLYILLSGIPSAPRRSAADSSPSLLIRNKLN